jgi:predicted GNAT family acetyltransferase
MKCVLPGAESLSPKKQNERLREICRRVFGTDEGKIVLNMLLTDLHLFEKNLSTGDNALNEYAKFLIRERLGVSNTVSLTDTVIAGAETAASRRG